MGDRLAATDDEGITAEADGSRACNSAEGLVPTQFALHHEAAKEASLQAGCTIAVTINAESKFVELVRAWLVSLPHDLKIAFDAMDDENLPRPVRELATAVAIYIVSPNEFIADRNDQVVSYADDAVLLRLALHQALGAGEDEQTFRGRFPELFESLDENLGLCRAVMGDLMAWLEGKVRTLATIEYKGKKIAKYLDDDEAREQLFDDGLVFRTDYPVDEKTIGDKLKKAQTVVEVMKRRRADEVRAKGVAASR
jgi:uncharacterized membrane protein YkvA (DUF1232 family)